MKKYLKKIYLFWFFVCSVITIVMILDIKRPIDYLLGNYKENSMLVTSITFPNTTSKRSSVTVNGIIKGVPVYLSEYDNDMRYVYEYLDPKILEDIDYSDDLTKLNIHIPVVKFKNSNNLLLIRKGANKNKILKNWFTPILSLFLLGYLPLILLFFILKIIKNDKQSN